MAVKQGDILTKKKMKIIPTVIFILILFGVLGYSLIQYAEKRVKQNLLEELTPIQQACKRAQGCFLIPDGWIARDCPNTSKYSQDLPAATGCASLPENSSYRALIYRATPDEFFVRWRYVADMELVVRGGARRGMSAQEVAIP